MDYHEDAPKRCAHGWLVGRCPHPPCLNAPAAAVPEAQDGREAVLREAFIEAVLDQTVPQEIQDVGARQVKDVVTIAKWLAPAAVDWALDIAAALTPSAAVREQDADVRRGGFPEPEPVAYGWVMSRNAAGYPDEVRWLDPADVIIRRSAQDECGAAVETVARQVICHAVDGTIEWENYPDIGQADWCDVVARVAQLISSLASERRLYQAAYDLLAARADRES